MEIEWSKEMKTIKLTQGREAIVDDDDYERLSQFKWQFSGRYAVRMERRPDGSRRTVQMHWMVINCPDGHERDHINGNKLDNRKSNLRICTRSQNQMNRPRLPNNTTGVKGVSWHVRQKKYIVQVTVNGKRKPKYFKTLSAAANEAETQIRERHKEFART